MIALLITIFVIGYLTIAFEHSLKVNKAAVALVTGVLCWTVYILYTDDKHLVNEQLQHNLGELSGILFFLLGAMAIVELIDAHDGFDLITTRITQLNKVKLLWIVALITFFLSALLDNLTTTIVIVSLLRKLIKKEEDRLLFCGIVVIAANAGGVWSPIGDVTTTMLWISGQITAGNIVMKLIAPSLVCLVAPLIFLSFKLKGTVERPNLDVVKNHKALSVKHQMIVFFSGVLMLVLVPVFKTFTHLPPYMGILIGLGVLWIITEIIHGKKDEVDKHILSVVYALRKIDTPSILFFFGILVSIAALQSAGILTSLATWMTNTIANDDIIVLSLGLLSGIVDNVPLVAAVQGMYSLTDYPTDHYFWEFLAYATGTGGSWLIIGSAAGVAAMGIEKIGFFWYLKKISVLALIGYFAGAAVYILQHQLFGL
ncbi:sodium:proton antiporter NhaD [Aurantibacillus circumpalustris]|uniref:sodium:proton antiporter NhaD n=1 Tax=Aurantibacillus circumpalustris TaxID=3036359 RepID=UPI00295AAE6B|nr:sodium:proton antiporter NhaD [Aurantibacillus circumpalustris]